MNANKSIDTQWRQYAATFLAEAQHKGMNQEEINHCLTYAKKLAKAGLPIIYDGVHFSMLVGYSLNYVYGAATRQKTHYRYFEIAKRSGGKRIIAEPLPSLKEIQKWILSNILSNVEISPAAKAFAEGRSIKENARFHRGQKYVLTVDVKDFFPSLTSRRVYAAFKRMGYSRHVSALLTDLCCLEGALPQGAPTSPYLSNIICNALDKKHLAFSKKLGIRYTRYADDLTFSGDFRPGDVISYAYKSMREYGLKPNYEKTRLLRQHQRQEVTGIVVNSKLQAPREIRRKLRQDAYYISKFGLDQHALQRGVEQAHYREHLLGQAGFVRFINPRDRDAVQLQRAILRISPEEDE